MIAETKPGRGNGVGRADELSRKKKKNYILVELANILNADSSESVNLSYRQGVLIYLMNFRGCALGPRRLIGVDAGLCGSFEHCVRGALSFVGNTGSIGKFR